jgi:hypothetical protein
LVGVSFHTNVCPQYFYHRHYNTLHFYLPLIFSIVYDQIKDQKFRKIVFFFTS